MRRMTVNAIVSEDIAYSETQKLVTGHIPADDSLSSGGAPAISRQTVINLLMLIYFTSGICSLIDEVVWIRILKLTLGNTVYASSIVVSTFMGGLALGAFIRGRYSDRFKKRLRLYALLETIITASVLSLPWGLRIADKFYVWFYRAYDPTHRDLLILQVIISGLILIVPSMLMGSTLPLLGRFVTSFEKETGRLVGRLYAFNTLGAAAGCFLAGFVLIRAFGVMNTLYAAAVLNLLVAFGGWLLSRLPGFEVEQQGKENLPINVEAVATKAGDSRMFVLAIAFFLSGAISIGYELLWMRSVVHLFSGYTYVFSSVLTVYLLGNVIGAGIGSGLAKQLKCPAAGFAITLSLLGFCGIFYLPFLILWTSKVLPGINREIELTGRLIPLSAYMFKPLVYSIFLFLVPSIIMGTGFPIALQAWANRVHKVGWSTGTAYGTNTIGAVMGGIVTGFIFIPLLGTQLSISILGLAGIWTAGFMWLLFTDNIKIIGRFGFLATAGLLTVVALKMPPDLFNAVVKSNPRLPKQLELLAVEEGVSTTVSLHRDPQEDTLYLCTSGQRVAGDTYFWRSDQKMLGHFGVLLNSNAKKVLSVGFGSGESTACMALHKLERAACVEIAPEMVNLSLRFFKHINLGDKLNEEIDMIYMDAKNYIHLTDDKYDAIVNDSIHPKHFAENSSLYAKEYFEDAKKRLEKNGLFISWIPTHNVEPISVLNSIIGTMMEVFPHVTIWYMTPDPAQYFLVVGSEQRQYFSPKHMDTELLRDNVGNSLSEININSSKDVMSCYIGDENDLRRSIKSFSINSDFRPFIEFTTANRPAGDSVFGRFISSVRNNSVYRHIDWNGFSKQEKKKWLSDYEQVHNASSYLLMSNSTRNLMDKLKYCMEGLTVLPENPALLDLRKRTDREIYYFYSKLLQSGKEETVLLQVENILKIHPKSAVSWMIKSRCMQTMGKMQEGLEAATSAVRLASDNADTHFLLGSILFSAGQLEEAVAEYREALQLSEEYRKYAIYSQAGMTDALSQAVTASGKHAVIEAASGEQFESSLSGRLKETTEDISQSKVLSEVGSSIVE
jgi:spermidine synthase